MAISKIVTNSVTDEITITGLTATRANTIAVNSNNYSLGVHSNSAVNVTVNVAESTFFTANLANNSTWDFQGAPDSSKSTGFVLEITNGGNYTVTWPGSVDWVDGTAPTLTSGGIDQLVFTTRDAGTTWFGFVAGLDIK